MPSKRVRAGDITALVSDTEHNGIKCKMLSSCLHVPYDCLQVGVSAHDGPLSLCPPPVSLRRVSTEESKVPNICRNAEVGDGSRRTWPLAVTYSHPPRPASILEARPLTFLSGAAVCEMINETKLQGLRESRKQN